MKNTFGGFLRNSPPIIMGGVLMFRSGRMRRTGARSSASGTSSPTQSWAGCTTDTRESSFWKRQGHEPIKCRAAYDVLEEKNNLQLNIRCASDSYNFDMLASATLASNAVSGSWSEASRNVAGKISGTAEGDHIDVVVDSAAFSASLALTTLGDRQSVVIKSKEANTSVKGATITLQRS